MSYMQETDDWLTAILAAGPEDNEPEEEWFKRIKKQIKDRILESYKNGQKARPPRKSSRPPESLQKTRYATSGTRGTEPPYLRYLA